MVIMVVMVMMVLVIVRDDGDDDVEHPLSYKNGNNDYSCSMGATAHPVAK